MTVDLGSALSELIQGIQNIGNATTMVVQWLFSVFKFDLPDIYARIIVIIISGYAVYKYGSKLADIIVVLLLALIAATFLGIQLPTHFP